MVITLAAQPIRSRKNVGFPRAFDFSSERKGSGYENETRSVANFSVATSWFLVDVYQTVAITILNGDNM